MWLFESTLLFWIYNTHEKLNCIIIPVFILHNFGLIFILEALQSLYINGFPTFRYDDAAEILEAGS